MYLFTTGHLAEVHIIILYSNYIYISMDLILNFYVFMYLFNLRFGVEYSRTWVRSFATTVLYWCIPILNIVRYLGLIPLIRNACLVDFRFYKLQAGLLEL